MTTKAEVKNDLQVLSEKYFKQKYKMSKAEAEEIMSKGK